AGLAESEYCYVELLGPARLAADTKQITIETQAAMTIPDLVAALAEACPALVGSALDVEGQRVGEGYILNRNGRDFIKDPSALIFATSPFVGTAITTSAKYAVLARSPLTGFIGDSLSGSHLAVELKRTGYDAIVIHGACDDWSVLRITDSQIEIRDGRQLLG